MVSAVAEKRAAKLEEDYRRQDLQALEELDIPEHLKLDLREEFEQMYEEMKKEAFRMAARKQRSFVIAFSTGAALPRAPAAVLLYAVSLFVRDH